MVLGSILRDLFASRTGEPAKPAADSAPVVLNVGGHTKEVAIPQHYDGWRHWLLDIDPKVEPDVLCDARELQKLPPSHVDAVYCSHNLEHYYRHDAVRVLAGFMHVLKPDGFAEIRVPDLKFLIEHVVANHMDLDDTLYVSRGESILVRDVIYGWSAQIERSGDAFFAHKTGFTPSSLRAFLAAAGFAPVFIEERHRALEVRALGFKREPTSQQRALLRL